MSGSDRESLSSGEQDGDPRVCAQEQAPLSMEETEFSMIMPTTWRMIDLRPSTRDRAIERMVREGIGRSDQLAWLRRDTVKMMRHALSSLTEAGGFFAATYEEVVRGKPLSASALAFLGFSPEGPEGPTTDVETMVSLFDGDVSGEEVVDPPAIVALRVGNAVRTRARVTEQLAGAERPNTVDVVRFFVPVKEWDRLLVMVFSTPVLYAADAMAELFDQMAMGALWRRRTGT